MKELRWVASSRDDLLAFPPTAVREIGHGLYLAQLGSKHKDAKPLKGFGDAGVLEVVEDFDGDTFRAVYTVRFAEVIFLLHAFQKKSKSGIATPPKEMEKVRSRLKLAAAEYEKWRKEK